MYDVADFVIARKRRNYATGEPQLLFLARKKYMLLSVLPGQKSGISFRLFDVNVGAKMNVPAAQIKKEVMNLITFLKTLVL